MKYETGKQLVGLGVFIFVILGGVAFYQAMVNGIYWPGVCLIFTVVAIQAVSDHLENKGESEVKSSKK